MLTISRSPATPSPHRGVLATLCWWFLMAVTVIGAMIPWYTLHLFPVLTVGPAKVNVLDALVACAVVLALPRIVRGTLRGDAAALWVWAFMLAMIIPFIVGLRNPDSAFFAIREARALSFYALALVFATGGYRAEDFRAFAGGYVVGTVIAVAAVSAHVRWGMSLPGYQDILLKVPGWTHSLPAVQYLQWTTPVVAFLLGFAGFFAARSRWGQVGWAAALFVIAWYALAAAERWVHLLTAQAAVIMIAIPLGERWKARRTAALGAILAIIAVIWFGSATGNAWVSDWTKYSLLRWSVALTDGSLSYRIRELLAGLTVTARNPLIGGGLGAALPIAPAAGPVEPWHYVSTGYGFLLIRAGLLGLALYSGMVITALRLGWRSLRTEAALKPWPMRAVGMVGMTILLIANLLHPVVDIPEGVIAFSLFFGMLVSRPESPGAGVRLS